MPMQKRKGEKKNAYVSRCISQEVKNGMKQDQAIAVCISKWNEFSSEIDIENASRFFKNMDNK